MNLERIFENVLKEGSYAHDAIEKKWGLIILQMMKL